MDTKEPTSQDTPITTTSAFWKWTRRLLLMIIGLIIAAIILLQFSVVQTFLISKITKYLSDITQTTVTAERIKISPIDGVILQNLNIIGEKNDTILHTSSLNVSLRKNLFFLVKNQLSLSYIGLKGLRLHVITKEGETTSNFKQFLDKIIPTSGSKSASSSFNLDVKEVDLSDIKIYIKDENKGSSNEIKLVAGALDINYIDLVCSEFDINEIILDRPSFHNLIYEYECDITDDLAIPQADSRAESLGLPTITVRELVIKDGYFRQQNDLVITEEKFKDYLDYNNFYLEKINIYFKNLRMYNGNEIFARLQTLNAIDNTGFSINNISSDTISINTNSAELKSFVIDMGKTVVKDHLKFSFADFSAFNDFARDVVLNADLKDSKVYLDDLVHFVRSLSNIPFVKNNKAEIIEVNGRYYGKVNNLAGRDVDIKLGEKLSLSGSFNTRDLLDADNTVLNIRLDRFDTSMRKIKMILPSFNPPANFNKLGSIHFTGRFDGYLENFVAYGKLRSDLGSAEMDMQLDITQGSDKANYSGTLDLHNFNLGKWSDNPDIGLVNFKSKVAEGKGLTLNTVRADLAATIKSLQFKRYLYKDLILDGKIDRNTFDGIFKVEDDNLNLNFDGTFEYINQQAFLNFKSNVKQIDLMALNLSSSPLKFSANMDINLSGTGLNDFIGQLNISNFQMQVKDSIYHLDTIGIGSKMLAQGGKEIFVKSDLGMVTINGNYDIPNMVRSVKKVIYNNNPQITKAWKEDIANYPGHQKFDFSVHLKKSSNFLSLLGLHQSSFKKLLIKGKLDTYKNELSLASDIPFLKIKGDSLQNLQLLVNSANRSGHITLHIDSTFAFNRHFNPIFLQTNVNADTVDFELTTEKIANNLENFDIMGKVTPHKKGYNLTLTENLLVMFGSKWNINPKNNIVFGDQYLNFENLLLTDGYRAIEINDINQNRGVELDVVNIDLDLVNGLIKYDKMIFGGTVNLSAKVTDVFAQDKAVAAYINVPDFSINGDKYGTVYVDVTRDENSPVKANVSIGDFLAIKGSYDINNKYIESRIKLRKAPMEIIQYLLKDGIKDTQGYINADFTFGGLTSDLKINGEGTVDQGKTTLIYTGATYFFDHQNLTLTNREINLDGAVITDIHGNRGTIRGGLTHDLFKNFGVNATLTGANVVGLNTTKADNPDYYGYGIGQMSAEFKGSFDQVDMKINAVSGPGTKLFIPINNAQTATDQSFIRFKNKDDKKNQDAKAYKGGGIDIEMTLIVTPDAELSLIFDEAKGDIIKGRGRGNLKINISRRGDFEVFGDYEIESGQYLFTAPLVPVAKPFVVDRGGRIVWTGDPINATLDITTKYRTRTSIEPFISEYLVNSNASLQSNTEVDVILKLGGSLFKPEIKLGLAFPNLTGDYANFAESKLRVLQGNDQELNGQVLGLIVFNTFIQSSRVSDVFGASGIQSASINTLSEFLSSQLSMYITNVLNSVVGEGSFITGIDFDVNVRNNTFNLAPSGFIPDEIAVRNTLNFKNDRLSLDIGGNYILQFQGTAINQVLPDFALEFKLTDDRKLKVRLYGKYDIDVSTFGLRDKYGLGVAYRTEFGSMVDFEKSIKEAAKKTINN